MSESEKRIAGIRERCGQATPGPWEVNEAEIGRGRTICLIEKQIVGNDGKTIGATSENTDFIAHAREDVPYLLDEIEYLQAQLSATIAGQETLQQLVLDVTCKYETSIKMHKVTADLLAESQRREKISTEALRLAISNHSTDERQIKRLMRHYRREAGGDAHER